MTATRGSSATAATEARPRPVAAGRLRLHDEADSTPPGRQARHPRVPLARTAPGESCRPAAPEEAGTRGRAGRFTSAARAAAPAGVITPPSSAGGTRWSSWTPRPQRRGARASRQRPPGGARPPNPRRIHPSPARAGRRRGRSRTTSTKPALRTSRGRCAACSCTIRGRSRRRASRRPAGSASGSGRRPATGKRQAAMKAAKKET